MFRKFLPAVALAALAFGTFGPVAAAPAQAGVFVAQPAFQIAQEDPTFQRPGRLRGFVLNFDHFNMTLGIHGHEVPVLLHQGTIIRPTGLTIQPHMLVRVDGVFAGGVFQADRIILIR
jgi:hypothetical protein